MMKSFFKKLAFVMALAMVVTLAAPAATASAADALGIVLQDDATWTVLEKDELAVDAEVDYRYKGAPKNFKELDPTWSSSDETVATVDKNGVVTGLKDGVATIKIALSNGQEGSIEVTVGKGEEVDTSYEVKQIAGDKLTITWADAVNATTDVTLYKIYNLPSGPVESKWPCEVTAKDGVVTVDAYVPFTDGDDYVLKFGEEVYGFTAYVGTITRIVVVPKDIKTGGTTLYACGEAPYRPIRFDVKFITDGGIEVTQPEDTELYFETVQADDGVDIDSTGAISYITSVGASAVVKAIYYYTDANGDGQELTDQFVIVGEAVPVPKFEAISSYALVADGTKVADAAWGTASVIYGEEAYIALKVKDTLKNEYYAGPVKLGDKDVAYGNEVGTITYMSADESKLLVGETDGKITAIADKGTAVVLVKLTYTSNDKTFTKNIYAIEVELKAEKKARTISAKGVTVLTIASIDSEADVTFTVVDQYGRAWTNWDKVEVKTTVEGAPALTVVQDVKDGNNLGSGKIAIDGTEFVGLNKASVTYTLKIDGAQQNFTVTLKKPLTGADSTIKANDFVLSATGVDVDGSKTGILRATIDACTAWSSSGIKYKVGNVAADKLVAYNDDKFWSENKVEGIEVNDVVVMVTKPDGKFIVPVIDSEGNITVPVSEVASGKALTVEATGTYKVTLYVVTAVTPNTGTASGSATVKKLSKAETTFTVNNKCDVMSISGYEKELKSDADTIQKVILELVNFKLGKDAYESLTSDDIVKVNGVFNSSAHKYYVNSIVVKTPIKETGCYFEQTLSIGKTFEVPYVTEK